MYIYSYSNSLKPSLDHNLYPTPHRTRSEISNPPILHKSVNLISAALLNIRSLNTKANFVHHYITSSDLSFFALTETWLDSNSRSIPALATPNNYEFLHNPRTNRTGGGVALICKSAFSPTLLPFHNFSSFELLVVKCNWFNLSVITIYRPPDTPTQKFLDEFSHFLTEIYGCKKHLLILGDFNIPLNKSSTFSNSFLALLDVFSLTQYIKYPTNPHGNILDLIISSFPIHSTNISDLSSSVSDHFLLDFNFVQNPISIFSRPRILVTSRNLSKINLKSFANDLHRSLSAMFDSSSPDKASDSFNQAISSTLNSHAPLRTKSIIQRPNSNWYFPHLRSLKTKLSLLRKKEKKSP